MGPSGDDVFLQRPQRPEEMAERTERVHVVEVLVGNVGDDVGRHAARRQVLQEEGSLLVSRRVLTCVEPKAGQNANIVFVHPLVEVVGQVVAEVVVGRVLEVDEYDRSSIVNVLGLPHHSGACGCGTIFTPEVITPSYFT